MEKIKVKTPIVEIDGDEMARVVWKMIKDKLIFPHIDITSQYFDLHIKNRDRTDDQVTIDAANAIKRYGVGVKCATITPDKERVEEYNLKKIWASPNGTIRSILDGTVFRKPIIAGNIKPLVVSWEKPIIIGRHAYGDVYSNAEIRVPGPGKAVISFSPSNNGEKGEEKTITHFAGPGIIQGIYNTDRSIRSFAKSCFKHAFEQGMDLWFSVKDTISKTYDYRFREIFDEEYRENWFTKFQSANIKYFFSLIDDAAARIIRSKGGMLWALKNYDGDVMSDMIAAAYGSIAMMTSTLVSPNGYFEYEAAHGTVRKHYYRYLNKEETSTNPMAIIFAWSGCLQKRGEIDKNSSLVRFSNMLEESAIDTIESGIMTADLVNVAYENTNNVRVGTQRFINEIAVRLNKKIESLI